MAGQHKLIASRSARFAGLCALVAVAHLVLIALLAHMLQANRLLRPMPAPMFTRILQAEAPAAAAAPVPDAQPREKPARPRRPAVTTIAAAPQPAQPEASAPLPDSPPAEKPPVESPQPATPPEPAQPLPDTGDSSQAAAASAAASAAAGAPLNTPGISNTETWPTDTRLSYLVTGNYRGPLDGRATVQWQRDGTRYQVKVDVTVATFYGFTMTSQGDVTPTGLSPRAYEEQRGSSTPRTLRFTEDTVVRGTLAPEPRPQAVQDTASQFIELSHRFQMGHEALDVPGRVNMYLARPGGVDLWTYDIVEREMLQTYAGPVETFHLRPRPLANPRGNITAEIWFAPALLYLPVRIRLNMGDDAFVDLMVEKIEQTR